MALRYESTGNKRELLTAPLVKGVAGTINYLHASPFYALTLHVL